MKDKHGIIFKKFFNLLMKEVFRRLQINKVCLSAFLYDASYNKGWDLQKRVLKVGKMSHCQELKFWEKYSISGKLPTMLFYSISLQKNVILISEG